MDSSSAAVNPGLELKLGPEDTLYDPLPTPTSIRVLLLAPGQTEDEEICCYFFPCDLNKDPAVDPSSPQPFESLSFAEASGLGCEDAKRKFASHADSYNEEIGTGAIGTSSHRQKKASSKGKEPATSCNDVKHTLSEVVDSFTTSTVSEMLHPFQRFTALSYVWGSPDAPKSILVDGKTRFWVTQNLYDALRSLRRPDEARAFWIDAICINQSDPDEKRLQIALMRRIYRQAHEVLAYIPQTPENNQPFNKLVGLILRAYERCQEVLGSGPIPMEEPHESDVTTVFEGSNLQMRKLAGPVKPTGTCIEDHGLPDENDPIWDC